MAREESGIALGPVTDEKRSPYTCSIAATTTTAAAAAAAPRSCLVFYASGHWIAGKYYLRGTVETERTSVVHLLTPNTRYIGFVVFMASVVSPEPFSLHPGFGVVSCAGLTEAQTLPWAGISAFDHFVSGQAQPCARRPRGPRTLVHRVRALPPISKGETLV